MVGKALNQELDDVARHVEQARASVTAEDWLRAAQALLAVQDRVGRVLREIDLQRTTPRADGDGVSLGGQPEDIS